MKTYVNLVKHRLLGQGDSDTALWEKVGYDLNDVFHLIGLDMRMLYGGPSEAVMHAIYRQNSGFSHIVIGRKHADAPYDDKTAIWGDFDAVSSRTRRRAHASRSRSASRRSTSP